MNFDWLPDWVPELLASVGAVAWVLFVMLCAVVGVAVLLLGCLYIVVAWIEASRGRSDRDD